ncbi:MAG: hypothetical protein WCT14_19625 [Treponemataceae bacterium]
MYGSVDWRDAKYEEVLEQEFRGLERRRESDPSLTVSDVEGQLKHLYIMQGSDWAGRGELQDIILSATIAAYESFIGSWQVFVK